MIPVSESSCGGGGLGAAAALDFLDSSRGGSEGENNTTTSPALPQPSHSPPTASALEQLRPENEWVLPSHALLSDRDPCSAVYVASFLGPRGGTARFLNVFLANLTAWFLNVSVS